MRALRLISLFGGLFLQVISLATLLHLASFTMVLPMHILGAILWGWGSGFFMRDDQRSFWWLPSSVALIFPVIGPLASLILIFVLQRPLVEHARNDYVIWDDDSDSRWKDQPVTELAAHSIVEILHSPSPHRRRNAILALRNLEPQLAIPLLRKALLDSDEQVRIYSQNILASILSHFESRIKDLEQLQRNSPGAAGPAIRLAEYYYELVYLDVAGDSEAATHYLKKALALLEQVASAEPDNRHVPLLGLKFALRAEDITLARQWLQRLESFQFDEMQVMPWRLEIAYREHQWESLRQMFGEFQNMKPINPKITNLARFWFGKNKASA